MNRFTSSVLVSLLLSMVAFSQTQNMSQLTDHTVAQFSKDLPNLANLRTLIHFYRKRAGAMKYEVEMDRKRRSERGIARETTREKQYAYFMQMADLFENASAHVDAIKQAPFLSDPVDTKAHRAKLRTISAQVADLHAKSPFKKRNS